MNLQQWIAYLVLVGLLSFIIGAQNYFLKYEVTQTEILKIEIEKLNNKSCK